MSFLINKHIKLLHFKFHSGFKTRVQYRTKIQNSFKDIAQTQFQNNKMTSFRTYLLIIMYNLCAYTYMAVFKVLNSFLQLKISI